MPFGESSPISSERSSGNSRIADAGYAQDEHDHRTEDEAHPEAADPANEFNDENIFMMGARRAPRLPAWTSSREQAPSAVPFHPLDRRYRFSDLRFLSCSPNGVRTRVSTLRAWSGSSL